METISNMRYQIPGRLQSQNIYLSRTLSRDGFCTTNLSRKPAGHRGLSACFGSPTLSHGHPQFCFKKQPFPRKRNSRLAHLRRLCSNPHQQSKNPLRQRTTWLGSEINRVCPELDNHRPLYESIPLGTFPQDQKRSQAPYPDESSGKHSRVVY